MYVQLCVYMDVSYGDQRWLVLKKKKNNNNNHCACRKGCGSARTINNDEIMLWAARLQHMKEGKDHFQCTTIEKEKKPKEHTAATPIEI